MIYFTLLSHYRRSVSHFEYIAANGERSGMCMCLDFVFFSYYKNSNTHLLLLLLVACAPLTKDQNLDRTRQFDIDKSIRLSVVQQTSRFIGIHISWCWKIYGHFRSHWNHIIYTRSHTRQRKKIVYRKIHEQILNTFHVRIDGKWLYFSSPLSRCSTARHLLAVLNYYNTFFLVRVLEICPNSGHFGWIYISEIN